MGGVGYFAMPPGFEGVVTANKFFPKPRQVLRSLEPKPVIRGAIIYAFLLEGSEFRNQSGWNEQVQ